jgi:nucleoside-diphosphate-sugar epimerase
LVTGACGTVGSAVVAALEREKRPCVATDVDARWQPDPSGRMTVRRADLRDLGSVMELVHGVDAIVHTANIPVSGFEPDHRTFVDNVTINWNVFHAAAMSGVRRVVWLSSVVVFGVPFAHGSPDYLPIDDTHPRRPENAYALSKSVSEDIAEYFARSSDTSYVALRATLVQDEWHYQSLAGVHDEQRLWALWTHIALPDMARACLAAIDAPVTGTLAVTIADRRTLSDTPSHELADRFHHGVERRWPADADPRAAFHDVEPALELLGFVAETKPAALTRSAVLP